MITVLNLSQVLENMNQTKFLEILSQYPRVLKWWSELKDKTLLIPSNEALEDNDNYKKILEFEEDEFQETVESLVIDVKMESADFSNNQYVPTMNNKIKLLISVFWPVSIFLLCCFILFTKYIFTKNIIQDAKVKISNFNCNNHQFDFKKSLIQNEYKNTNYFLIVMKSKLVGIL